MRRPEPGALFPSFFLGGFEGASHKRPDGVRVDPIAATGHATFAATDYALMRRHGLTGLRDALRWHRIEAVPGRYDWTSFLPMLRAARAAGVTVAWDLCHWGYPDWLDPWSEAFPERLAAFAHAAATLVAGEQEAPPIWCPVNEISFWAWGGAEVGCLNPAITGNGAAFKRQLVRAAILAARSVRAVDPACRLLWAEPAIAIVGNPDLPGSVEGGAEGHRLAQFEALDMVSGRRDPELGGTAELLDVVGLNYYPRNHWLDGGPVLTPAEPGYRPLAAMLAETHARYGRPLLLAETGTEGPERAAWLDHVASGVAEARAAGVPVEGICLYPVLDYPGWDDGRHCPCGLFDGLSPARPVYNPLAAALALWQRRFEPWAALEIAS